MRRRKPAEEAGIRRKRSSVFILLGLLLLSCASRMPPPGKPDIDPPSIKIVSPKNGDTLRGVFYVKYIYRDKSPLAKFWLFIDSRKVVEDSILRDSIELHTDSLLDTVHFLHAEAMDKWDNRGKSNTVRVFTLLGKRREKKNEGMDREHQKSKEKSR